MDNAEKELVEMLNKHYIKLVSFFCPFCVSLVTVISGVKKKDDE